MWLKPQLLKKQVVHKRSKGYTLMEMMVTVALMAIVIALAAPPLSDFIKNNQLTSTANKLVSAIILAKNEAVSRRRTTTITGDDDGWTVKVIPLTTTTGVEIARYSLDDNMGLRFSLATIRDNGMTFTPDGFRDMSGTPLPFSFTVCATDTTNTRVVNVSTAGTTTVSKGTTCPAQLP
jgi:type IV fimbrial biogenesis protein FimT